jgi:fluoride exporter
MILIAFAGGLGALTRYLFDTWVNARARAWAPRLGVPLGTVLINVTGSFLLGLLTGWWLFHTSDQGWKLAVGVGFLGGYTTFSTASVEAARLILADRRPAAALHALTMLVASIGAAGAGLWLTT